MTLYMVALVGEWEVMVAPAPIMALDEDQAKAHALIDAARKHPDWDFDRIQVLCRPF